MTPLPRSRCALCGSFYRSHDCGDRRLCPDGTGNTFAARPCVKRASMSFDDAEVGFLVDVLAAVEQRKPLSSLARKPELASVARKVMALRKAAAEGRS